eukprot:Rhum_TRINITY_DN14717_c15_g5::Rhum_TRINITY_DN14717_c15_g5_i1::g.113971::m.113971
MLVQGDGQHAGHHVADEGEPQLRRVALAVLVGEQRQRLDGALQHDDGVLRAVHTLRQLRQRDGDEDARRHLVAREPVHVHLPPQPAEEREGEGVVQVRRHRLGQVDRQRAGVGRLAEHVQASFEQPAEVGVVLRRRLDRARLRRRGLDALGEDDPVARQQHAARLHRLRHGPHQARPQLHLRDPLRPLRGDAQALQSEPDGRHRRERKGLVPGRRRALPPAVVVVLDKGRGPLRGAVEEGQQGLVEPFRLVLRVGVEVRAPRAVPEESVRDHVRRHVLEDKRHAAKGLTPERRGGELRGGRVVLLALAHRDDADGEVAGLRAVQHEEDSVTGVVRRLLDGQHPAPARRDDRDAALVDRPHRVRHLSDEGREVVLELGHDGRLVVLVLGRAHAVLALKPGLPLHALASGAPAHHARRLPAAAAARCALHGRHRLGEAGGAVERGGDLLAACGTRQAQQRRHTLAGLAELVHGALLLRPRRHLLDLRPLAPRPNRHLVLQPVLVLHLVEEGEERAPRGDVRAVDGEDGKVLVHACAAPRTRLVDARQHHHAALLLHLDADAVLLRHLVDAVRRLHRELRVVLRLLVQHRQQRLAAQVEHRVRPQDVQVAGVGVLRRLLRHGRRRQLRTLTRHQRVHRRRRQVVGCAGAYPRLAVVPDSLPRVDLHEGPALQRDATRLAHVQPVRLVRARQPVHCRRLLQRVHDPHLLPSVPPRAREHLQLVPPLLGGLRPATPRGRPAAHRRARAGGRHAALRRRDGHRLLLSAEPRRLLLRSRRRRGSGGRGHRRGRRRLHLHLRTAPLRRRHGGRRSSLLLVQLRHRRVPDRGGRIRSSGHRSRRRGDSCHRGRRLGVGGVAERLLRRRRPRPATGGHCSGGGRLLDGGGHVDGRHLLLQLVARPAARLLRRRRAGARRHGARRRRRGSAGRLLQRFPRLLDARLRGRRGLRRGDASRRRRTPRPAHGPQPPRRLVRATRGRRGRRALAVRPLDGLDPEALRALRVVVGEDAHGLPALEGGEGEAEHALGAEGVVVGAHSLVLAAEAGLQVGERAPRVPARRRGEREGERLRVDGRVAARVVVVIVVVIVRHLVCVRVVRRRRRRHRLRRRVRRRRVVVCRRRRPRCRCRLLVSFSDRQRRSVRRRRLRCCRRRCRRSGGRVGLLLVEGGRVRSDGVAVGGACARGRVDVDAAQDGACGRGGRGAVVVELPAARGGDGEAGGRGVAWEEGRDGCAVDTEGDAARGRHGDGDDVAGDDGRVPGGYRVRLGEEDRAVARRRAGDAGVRQHVAVALGVAAVHAEPECVAVRVAAAAAA